MFNQPVVLDTVTTDRLPFLCLVNWSYMFSCRSFYSIVLARRLHRNHSNEPISVFRSITGCWIWTPGWHLEHCLHGIDSVFIFLILKCYSLLACTIQAFELATGDRLFEPPPDNEYHLALIIQLLGYIPKNIVSSGKNSHDYFDKKGSCFWDFGMLLSSKVNFLACVSR